MGRNRRRVPGTKIHAPLPAGLTRSRLVDRIAEQAPGVLLVVAPAGSGKTTLLAHAASRWDGASAWATLDGFDRRPGSLVATLAAAVGMDEAEEMIDVVAALDDGVRRLLVLDDAHELAGSPALDDLRVLQRYRPPDTTLVLGSRHLSGFQRWRWETTDEVSVVDFDALRFRIWEVDELFRSVFELPLTTREVHALTTHTGGWAIALHLLAVAARRSPRSMTELLRGSGRITHRSIREYLREQVLASLRAEDRRLLRRLSVLARITPESAAALTGTRDVVARLDFLAEISLLGAGPDGTGFDLQELLRAHLLAELAEELGAEGANEWHRRAAAVLESAGALPDAICASGRAGDWANVARLAAAGGGGMPGPWLEGMPSELRFRDPWIVRAEGIARLRDGDLGAAMLRLGEAVELFAESGGDRSTEQLHQELAAWFDPAGGYAGWIATLRRALDRPRGVVDGQAGIDRRYRAFVEGMVALADGRLRDARRHLVEAAADHGELACFARIGLLIVDRFDGMIDIDRVQRVIVEARERRLPALEPVIDAVSGRNTRTDDLLRAARARHAGADDHGAAFLVVWAGLWGSLGIDRDAGAGSAMRPERSAGIGEADLASLRTVAERVGIGAVDEFLDVGDRVRALSTGAKVAQLARNPNPLARAVDLAGAGQEEQARRLADANGFSHWIDGVLASVAASGSRPDSEAASETELGTGGDGGRGLGVRVLGPIEISVGSNANAVAGLRPRHREVLFALALRPNQWIHREVLADWMWPDADARSATRSLQTAVSAVRRAIDPDADRGESILTRSGERYRLDVERSRCDLCRFSDHLDAAVDEVRRGHEDLALDHLDRGLAEWRGEPAAEAGPVDWAVQRRLELHGFLADRVVWVIESSSPSSRSTSILVKVTRIEPHDDRIWRLALEHAVATHASATRRGLLIAYERVRAVDEPDAAGGRATINAGSRPSGGRGPA